MKTKGVLACTTTANVAGPDMPAPGTWKRHYERLLELRTRTAQDAGELANASGEAGSRFGMDPADAATDSFDRDLAYSLLAMEENALTEIDSALQRIQEGRYGVCELTGQLIPRQRLEAIPWARYTVEAQAEMERTGDAPRPHLSKLESLEPNRLESQ
jgi:DnaK suppressor protein